MIDETVIDRFALTTAEQGTLHLALTIKEGALVWVCESQRGDFEISDAKVLAFVYLHMLSKPLSELQHGTKKR